MARPLQISYPGAFYHVTSRGNERKAVFKGTGDREKFLGYLATASQRYDARVEFRGHVVPLLLKIKRTKSTPEPLF